jgi:translation initiation factor IF-2
MATRTTSRTGPKKAGAEKPAGGTRTGAAATRTAPAKTLPAKKAPAASPEPAPAPKAPVETLSLIEPQEKKPRRAPRPAGETASVLPPISRIRKPEPTSEPKPEPQIAPEPAVVARPVREQKAALDLISAPSPRQPPPAPVAPQAPIAEEPATEAPVDEEKIIHIKPPIIVKDLATALGLKPFQLISELMEMNIFAAINQSIEADVATAICTRHGYVFEKEKREKGAGVHKVEAVIEAPKAPEVQKEDELQLRAPIVTFMGHVDHGKTSLMDAIRKTRVAAGEAGGITQHIGAYRVEYNGHPITFLDTPGHAAFTAMRARGANVTDIVVLVVAADDGLMPQTLEAINHAKAAKVSIIVAINKIDLPGANVDKVKGQLQERDLTPEDWGGETICCPVSATKGTNIDQLLEMILLQAEVLELKANPNADARGTVIEAQVESGRGPTATVIVRSGTLKVGDPFICGNYSGKVKLLIDDMGQNMKSAGPSVPAKVLGFSGLPNAGDEFLVMESERSAKALSEERLAELRQEKLTTPQRATLENLFENLAENQRKVLKIVLKADVQGSLEALVGSLEQIESKKIDLEIIHSGVGPITESDVLLGTASDAVIVGFNVKVESSASNAAKREGVQIKLYSIIYELIDQIKEAMAGLLDPELRETVIGHAEVKQVFELSRGVVAGCLVTDGRVTRSARARTLRKRQPIYDGGVATLRRFQDDVKEVRAGMECGIKLGDFNDYEVGDIIECYTLEKVAQQL